MYNVKQSVRNKVKREQVNTTNEKMAANSQESGNAQEVEIT